MTSSTKPEVHSTLPS